MNAAGEQPTRPADEERTDGPQPDGEPAAPATEPASREVDIEEFLRVLPHLESADLMAMSATYQHADPAARAAARNAASALARKGRVGDELARLQGSIIQWAGSDMSASAAITFDTVRPDQVLGDVRRQAVPPLLDAATALLLRDALPPEAREALLEPWDSAVS